MRTRSTLINGLILSIASLLLAGCSKGDSAAPDPAAPAMYFPPNNSAEWETVTAAELQWNTSAIPDLIDYLDQKQSKAFIVLKNGKIVLEHYFGTFTRDSAWYWASAGKTVTALMAGIAAGEGILDLDAATRVYLGNGWTSLPADKEALIKVRHQLSMTTGLDDAYQPDSDCTSAACLQYRADAGTRWAYHNAPYTLLEQVLEAATGKSFQQYFQEKICNRTGMSGLWLGLGYNNVLFSHPRSMARFGLLLLNRGDWNGQSLLSDKTYFDLMINSSQAFNPSYGYLTWLNGKSGYKLPGLQFNFSGSLVPNAPADMYAALGKNDQKIYVVPSQGLVIIRMGESAGNSQLALSSFDNELWGKLRSVIQ